MQLSLAYFSVLVSVKVVKDIVQIVLFLAKFVADHTGYELVIVYLAILVQVHILHYRVELFGVVFDVFVLESGLHFSHRNETVTVSIYRFK